MNKPLIALLFASSMLHTVQASLPGKSEWMPKKDPLITPSEAVKAMTEELLDLHNAFSSTLFYIEDKARNADDRNTIETPLGKERWNRVNEVFQTTNLLTIELIVQFRKILHTNDGQAKERCGKLIADLPQQNLYFCIWDGHQAILRRTEHTSSYQAKLRSLLASATLKESKS